ncbi:single-stranded DNA-binding protein [Candidatus Saccharibacteria bacterium]|nr:MAG: single-stranded DNA-binding protein [Candidatus Saccharibacteria bacterium]
MAKGFNKVILMGNLTRDPETRTTPNGQSVTNFSLAVNRTWKGQDGQTNEDVSYIDCVAWGKPGEIIAQYLGKGRAVLVSGRLDQRSWEDKETGGKRSKVEVIVEDFNFVGDGQGGSAGNSGGYNSGGSSGSSSASKKKDEPQIEDINDKPIDLSEIPF